MNTQSKKALGGLAVLTILFAFVGPGAADSAEPESGVERPGVINQEPAEELEGGGASGSIPDAPQAPEVGPPSEPGEEGEEAPEGEID